MPALLIRLEQGLPVPALDRRPPLPEHLLPIWGAFFELDTCRPVGFGAGQIPWTVIDRWAERDGIDDPDEFERFTTLIRAMDRAFLAHHAKRKPTGGPGKNGGQGSHRT